MHGGIGVSEHFLERAAPSVTAADDAELQDPSAIWNGASMA
jgi:hypothetical protein